MPEKRLQDIFDAEIGIGPAEDDADLTEADLRPLIVFLIPGIRSNRVWAQNFHLTSRAVIGREIFPYVVSGAGELSSLDAIFRHRIAQFRQDFLDEIEVALSRHRDADVAFVCHSLGSSIFGEIAGRVRQVIEAGGRGHRAHAVVFLGSVCDRRHATTLGQLGRWSVNDVGGRDRIAYLAGLLNPFRYDPTGRFGMGRAPFQDRFFAAHDHSDPVAEAHLSNWVLPVLEEGILRRPAAPARIRGWTTFRWTRRVIWWGVLPALALATIWPAIT